MSFRLFIAVGLMLLSVPAQTAQTQEWRELYRQADSLNAKGFGPAMPRALALAEKALPGAEAEFGVSDTGVTKVLDLMASLLASSSIVRLRDALKYSLRSLDIKEAAYGPDDPKVADALQDLSGIYLSMRKAADARRVLTRALQIYEQKNATASPTYAFTLHNIAVNCAAEGDYTKAAHFYTRALDALRKAVPVGDPSLAYTLTMFAVTLWSLGSFDEAEPLLEEALQNWKNHYGAKSIQTSICLGNLTQHYKLQGRYAEAEARARSEQPPDSDTLESGDPMKGRMLVAKGRDLYVQQRYTETLVTLARAVEIWRHTAEPQPLTVTALALMGRCSLHLRRYTQAESLYVDALTMQDTLYERVSSRKVELWLGLAQVHMQSGKMRSADSLLNRALVSQEHRSTWYNATLADVLDAYVQFYRRTGDLGRALRIAERAVGMRVGNFRRNVRVLAEGSARSYSALVRRSIDGYLSAVVDSRDPEPDVVRNAAEIILSTKGQTTEQALLRRKRLVRETDSVTVALAEEYRSAQFRLATRYVDGPQSGDVSEFVRKLDSLEAGANQLEALLARRSASYARSEGEQRVSLRGIADGLSRDAVAVEFFSFDYVQLDPEKTVPRYIALILDRSGGFSLVDLGDAERIHQPIELYRRHLAEVAGRGRPVSTEDEAAYRTVAARLYDLIWRPLEPALSGKKTVFVAPDAGLNLVSFAGLVCSDGRYLIERHPLHYVSAARDIMHRDSAEVSGTGLLAMGDPDFDAAASVRIAARPGNTGASTKGDPYQLRNLRSGCDQFKNMTVSRLPNSRNEVSRISESFRRYNPLESRLVLLGTMASEEEFKASAPGKQIIHLATHGYVLDGSCLPVGSGISGSGENPLLGSGVLLAGANLHGRGARETGSEDGILTALEVSALELQGVDLVVLSACETGLGSVTQGEGIYGLRRAFQMAGAKTVVSTLWQVPDVESVKFMKNLYEAMAPSRHASADSYPLLMQHVAVQRIAEQRKRGRPTHPFTWGAYLATGEWRMQ